MSTSRYDAIVVWPHGLEHLRSITAILHESPEFQVLCEHSFAPDSMAAFVREVYSRDYVPFDHLESKTAYLLKMPSEVKVVFVRTLRPEEYVADSGLFTHVESRTIRKLKTELRDQFNPRVTGIRTEHHVVHVTDHESHTDQILKLIGFSEGVEYLNRLPNGILSAPYHLDPFLEFLFRKIPWDAVRASIIHGAGQSFRKVPTPIPETPHFRFLDGEPEVYTQYVDSYTGTLLTDGHSTERFQKLSQSFDYMAPPNHLAPVLVQATAQNEYRILDGVHRAAILLHQHAPSLLAAVINP